MSVQIPQEAYPLTWPNSWPRHKGERFKAAFYGTAHVASKFNLGTTCTQKRAKSMAEAASLLNAELSRLRATRSVISTNVALKVDGMPMPNRRAPADPGAAIYFVLKGKPIVLACDRWNRVEDNVYAVAKHIESIRAQDRWGVGRIEQAFAGYAALPAPADLEPWWSVLEVREDDEQYIVRDTYLALAKKHHPDNGGDVEKMKRINNAWDAAKLARGWN